MLPLLSLLQAAADPLTNAVEWVAGSKPRAFLPPSFHGSRGNFAFALFSLLFTCAILCTALYGSMHNAWVARKYSSWRDPINMNRYIIWLMIIAILMGAAPDVIFLLMWGEVTEVTAWRLAEFDRFCDGLVMFPIVGAMFLWYRAKPVINYQLIRVPLPIDLWPKWTQMAPQIRVAALVAFISAGVALGK